MASPEDDALKIDVWLISCRVLGRQVEDAMLTAAWNSARAAGYRSLLGSYVPTAKNRQVANLYDRMGFALAGEDADGKRTYRAELTAERKFPAYFEIRAAC